ncbi:hypothetical protein CEW92_12925 [Bacillaceae bacterium SAS-127]|nr:hypothetical protein CEW92_12925 [Bacillaceae bacterium SAS-127]
MNLNEEEIDQLLKQSPQVIRKATEEEVLRFQAELHKRVQQHKRINNIEVAQLTEQLLQSIDAMDIFIQSEDDNLVTYSYTLKFDEEDFSYQDSGRMMVKL